MVSNRLVEEDYFMRSLVVIGVLASDFGLWFILLTNVDSRRSVWDLRVVSIWSLLSKEIRRVLRIATVE
ncbi:hypothetical protein ANAPH1_00471 [Anaplasma phagocytophilum]|nr:hypothetical protein ANAPH1_00471 [Anaplasma phagocytophilum]